MPSLMPILPTGALQALREALQAHRIVGRNALLLPSYAANYAESEAKYLAAKYDSLENYAVQKAAADAVHQKHNWNSDLISAKMRDVYFDRLPEKLKYSQDEALHNALAKIMGAPTTTSGAGSSMDPLYMHGKAVTKKQRIPESLYDVPTTWGTNETPKSPLYMSDNPLIATTNDYAMPTDGENLERFIWPYLADTKTDPTLIATIIGRGSNKGSNNKLVNEWMQDNQAPVSQHWGHVQDYLQAMGLDIELPPGILYKNMQDIPPRSYGNAPRTKFGELLNTRQNQLILYKPNTLIDEGALQPIFDDGTPFAQGGLAQVYANQHLGSNYFGPSK